MGGDEDGRQMRKVGGKREKLGRVLAFSIQGRLIEVVRSALHHGPQPHWMTGAVLLLEACHYLQFVK